MTVHGNCSCKWIASVIRRSATFPAPSYQTRSAWAVISREGTRDLNWMLQNEGRDQGRRRASPSSVTS